MPGPANDFHQRVTHKVQLEACEFSVSLFYARESWASSYFWQYQTHRTQSRSFDIGDPFLTLALLGLLSDTKFRDLYYSGFV